MERRRITVGGISSTWEKLLKTYNVTMAMTTAMAMAMIMIIVLTVRDKHCESVGEDVFQEDSRERRGSPQNSSIFSFHFSSLFASCLFSLKDIWSTNQIVRDTSLAAVFEDYASRKTGPAERITGMKVGRCGSR